MSAPRVIGDGMIGRAFAMCFPDDPDVTFYAAGVSNSSCTDQRDFEREQRRLEASFDPDRLLVYFSTTSDADTAYVKHKREMERIVQTQPHYLIAWLPTVVGRTPNPHTLFNYLYARISRGERFQLWNVGRQVIDIAHVVTEVEGQINSGTRNTTITMTPYWYSVDKIVAEFERVCDKKAIFDRAGGAPFTTHSSIAYLRRLIDKYYG